MTRDEAIQKISGRYWYHTMELLPGVITPGTSKWSAKQRLDILQVGPDLKGKKTLDIGSWDGMLAFELEKRGASVMATDIQNPDRTGFNTAKEIIGSRVPYERVSVYDLHKQFEKESFDWVFCFGVLYHLRHPLMALSSIHHVLKPDGLMFLEGEALLNYIENVDGSRNTTLDVKALAESDAPITLCYPGRYKTKPNWFIPNKACLKGWITSSGFTLENLVLDELPQQQRQRIITVSRKSGPPSMEHGLM